MKISDALVFIKDQLSPVSGDSAQAEAELILEHVLNCSRSEVYERRDNSITQSILSEIKLILKRRLLHEPLPYIFGKVYFHSREFIVDNHVLIPRPDTETLVEAILHNENGKDIAFLEIGVGSGAISAVLAQERPRWHCFATDISLHALFLAKRNCPDTVHLACSDVFASIKPENSFDFIVSNPPYISEPEMAGLDASVKDYEPLQALFGGKDGLDFYRVFASQAGSFLKRGGRIYCEIGYEQGESAKTVFSSHQGWKNVEVFRDLAGRTRVVRCCKV
jgi:release factor glutamine methyltransferase